RGRRSTSLTPASTGSGRGLHLLSSLSGDRLHLGRVVSKLKDALRKIRIPLFELGTGLADLALLRLKLYSLFLKVEPLTVPVKPDRLDGVIVARRLGFIQTLSVDLHNFAVAREVGNSDLVSHDSPSVCSRLIRGYNYRAGFIRLPGHSPSSTRPISRTLAV